MALHEEMARELGRKRHNGRVGKRVADFLYTENGQHFKWHLKLAKASDIYYGYSERMVYVVNEILPNREQVIVVGDQPEEVRVEFERLLLDHFALKWSGVISVHVTKGEPFDDERSLGSRECSMGVLYSTYQVATKSDGEKVYREWRPAFDEHEERVGTQVYDGAPRGTVIPYSPEMAEKLDSIIEAMYSLRLRLNDLLSQEKIIPTLKNVRSLGLPAPT